MSYAPHTWVNNESITAAKLNNMEEGISAGGGGIFKIEGTWDDQTGRLNTTVSYNDVIGAFEGGLLPVLYYPDFYDPFVYILRMTRYCTPEAIPDYSSGYFIDFDNGSEYRTLYAATATANMYWESGD